VRGVPSKRYPPQLAFVKKEAIKWNDDGSIELANLEEAERLDAGNYKPGERFTRGTFACAAAE
jgi:hypothetical protein